MMKIKILVVGATGATGKHVVAQLLEQGHNVHTIVRSKEHLYDLLNEINKSDATYDASKNDKLSVTTAAVLDLSEDQIADNISDVDAIVCCLGHNMTFKGVYGKPRKLVTDATKRLCKAVIKSESDRTNGNNKKPIKFILMGSDGVANPDGTDDKRPAVERGLLCIIRALVPPHRDNEGAVSYLSNELSQEAAGDAMEWVVVRPTDLINGEVSKYKLFLKPNGSLFGSSQATRSNVAKCMVDMILNEGLWDEWKFKMPVLHDMEKK